MAEQKSANQGNNPDLRGGTQGGEAARTLDESVKSEGTPGVGSASGGGHSGAVSRQVPSTNLANQDEGATSLYAGGKTAEQVRGYLDGIQFPALKDEIIRAARRNGAPDDVIGFLPMLSKTDYNSFEELIRDYPRLPGPDDIDPSKGGSRR